MKRLFLLGLILLIAMPALAYRIENVIIESGTNSVGTVGLDTGTNTIGAVGINAGTNVVGAVYNEPNTSIGTGQVSTISGTAVVLGVSTAIKKVTLITHRDNVYDTYVGNANVTNHESNAANVGFRLTSGVAVEIKVDNLTDVYLNTNNTGNRVYYMYEAR